MSTTAVSRSSRSKGEALGIDLEAAAKLAIVVRAVQRGEELRCHPPDRTSARDAKAAQVKLRMSGKREGSAKNRGPAKKKRYLNDQLGDMLFGFGDVETPLQSTIDMVEDVVVSYLQLLIRRADAQSSHRGRLTEQDILMQVRKDPRKYHRAKDLLVKWEEIKAAKSNDLDIDGHKL